MSRVPPVTASLTLLVTVLLAADPAAGPAAAQETPPGEFRFHGLDWTATAEQVRTRLAGVGFAYRDGLSDSEDLVFVGARRMGHPAVAIARMHEGELAKVALLLAARSAERLIPDYRAVVASRESTDDTGS